LTLTTTLILIAAAIAVLVSMNILARRPAEFGKTRLFPYFGVQFAALVAALYLAAHVLALLTRH
jgi:hypothetical protein